MADNLLVVHGGGPTAVINASLYGVIREALKRIHPLERFWEQSVEQAQSLQNSFLI